MLLHHREAYVCLFFDASELVPWNVRDLHVNDCDKEEHCTGSRSFLKRSVETTSE